MNGPEIFAFTQRVVPKACRNCSRARARIRRDRSVRIPPGEPIYARAPQEEAEDPSEKFFVGMRHCGNTVSCTIPIALKQAVEEGRHAAGSSGYAGRFRGWLFMGGHA